MPKPLIVPDFNSIEEYNAWVAELNETDIQACTDSEWEFIEKRLRNQLISFGLTQNEITESLNNLKSLNSIAEFNSAAEFNTWVAGLKEANIQKWTTQDWIKMYERLKELGIEETDKTITGSLIKLKRNYRLEEQYRNMLIKSGEELGQDLTKTEVSLVGAAVNNSYQDKYKSDMANITDKNFYQKTNYGNSGTVLSNYYEVAPKMEGRYLGTKMMGYATDKIIVISEKAEFLRFVTLIHEEGHYWFQLHREDQKAAFHNPNKSVIPLKGFEDHPDFFRLLELDFEYYIPEGTNHWAYTNQATEISTETLAQSAEKTFKKAINWSTEIESLTKQFSSYLGCAEDILYDNGNIKFIYRAKEGAMEDALKFLGETPDIECKYTPYNNSEGIYEVIIHDKNKVHSLCNKIATSGVRFENSLQSIIISGDNIDWNLVQKGNFKTIEFNNTHHLPEDLNLRKYYKATFKGNFPKCSNLPETVVCEKAIIPPGTNFSGVKNLTIHNDGITGVNFSGVKNLTIQTDVITGVNFSKAKNLTIQGHPNVTIENTMLPEKITVVDGNIIFKGEVRNVPQGIPAYTKFENTTITGIDLSHVRSPKFSGETVIDGVKLPKYANFYWCTSLEFKNMKDIPDILPPDIKITIGENCSQEVIEKINEHNKMVEELAQRRNVNKPRGKATPPAKGNTTNKGESTTPKREETGSRGTAATENHGNGTRTGTAATENHGKGTSANSGKVVATATEDAAKTAAAKTAVKTWVSRTTSAFSKVNKWIDKWFIDKPQEMVTNLRPMQQPWAQEMEKAGGQALKWSGKQLEKAAMKFAGEKAGQALMKSVTKVAARDATKSVGKKFALFGIVLGGYFSYERFKEGDNFGGAAEIVSTVAAFGGIPGLVASLEIDAGLMKRDMGESPIPFVEASRRLGDSSERAAQGDAYGAWVERGLAAMTMAMPTMPITPLRNALLDPIPGPKTLEEEIGMTLCLAHAKYICAKHNLMMTMNVDENLEQYMQQLEEEIRKSIIEITINRAKEKAITLNKASDELSAARREELTNLAIAPRDTFYDNPSVLAAENRRIMAAPMDPEVYALELEKVQKEANQILLDLGLAEIDFQNEYENQGSSSNTPDAEQENGTILYSPEVRTEVAYGLRMLNNILQKTLENLPQYNLIVGSNIEPVNLPLVETKANVTGTYGTSDWAKEQYINFNNQVDYKLDQDYLKKQESQNNYEKNTKLHGPWYVPWWLNNGKYGRQ